MKNNFKALFFSTIIWLMLWFFEGKVVSGYEQIILLLLMRIVVEQTED